MVPEQTQPNGSKRKSEIRLTQSLRTAYPTWGNTNKPTGEGGAPFSNDADGRQCNGRISGKKEDRMAKTDVRGRYGAIYKKAFDLVERWDLLQESANSKLGSVASGLGRLQIFKHDFNFSRLEEIPDARSLLKKKQILAIEKNLRELREILGQLERLVKMHANNARAGENIVKDLRIPSSSLKNRPSAADPSLSETIEGLQQLWRMYDQEYKTKKSIIGFLTYDSSERDVLDLQKVFNAEVHIDRQQLRDLQDLMVVEKAIR